MVTTAYSEQAREYLAECGGFVDTIQTGLRALQTTGAGTDNRPLINSVSRAVHSVRGAGFLGLTCLSEVAQGMEDALTPVRRGKSAPGPDCVRILLRAAALLRVLIQNPEANDLAGVQHVVAELSGLPGSGSDFEIKAGPNLDRDLRILLAEDDFANRILLQNFLSRYGKCQIAVNGAEAVESFRSALDGGQKYDLVCMDILMPEMDGRVAIRNMRALEEAHSVFSPDGVKIIMITGVDDTREVIRCFQEFSDGYLMKPIHLAKLLRQMKFLRLIP